MCWCDMIKDKPDIVPAMNIPLCWFTVQYAKLFTLENNNLERNMIMGLLRHHLSDFILLVS